MKISLSYQYSKKTELERIADTCVEISTSFFQENRFFLFDHLVRNRTKFIHLPKLDYSQIPKYWSKIKKLSRIPIMKNRTKLPIFTEMEVLDIKLIPVDEIKQFKERFKMHLHQLELQLTKIYENLKIKEIKVIIRPTLYGIVQTFSKPTLKNGILTIDFLYLRIDAQFHDLASMILAPIIMYTLDNPWNDAYWQDKNSITNYLMNHTSLSLLGDGYERPTYKGKQEYISEKQLSQSNEYYKELGFPIKNKLSINVNGHLYLNKKIIKGLSSTEVKVLKGFIRHKQKLISYEKIGDIIWNKDSSKYSLWAVTKHMQRIREKLKILDRNGELIQTVRGKGYILYD